MSDLTPTTGLLDAELPDVRFRDDQYLWFRVAENTFDNFVYSLKKPAPRRKS